MKTTLACCLVLSLCLYYGRGAEGRSQSSNTPPKVAFSLLSTARNRAIFVSESAYPGTMLAHLYANDPDDVMCSVADTDSVAEMHMTSDQSEYLLVLSQYLDYEMQISHEIHINCTDLSSTPMSTSLLVPLEVVDENDNPPVFDKDMYMIEVEENQLTETVILQVRAVDRDSNENADIRYSLSEPSNELAVHEISGEVFTTAALDREEKSHFEVTVIARDMGTPRLSSSATVNVTLSDVNDNAPVFAQNVFSVHVQENQEDELTVNLQAIDIDVDENGTVEYSLIEPNTRAAVFSIDKLSGILNITTIALDREFQSQIDVMVVARDCGTTRQLSSTATVRITVDDVNDNRPVFARLFFHARPLENSEIGTVILRIRAADRDSGDNGVISFALSGPSEGFEIEETSGIIYTTADLDRETRDRYEFVVVAHDNGTPQLSSTASVYVVVADVNDNAPVFEQSNYTTSIDEEQDVGTTFLQVKAEDQDDDRIRYYLGEPNDVVRIDSVNGMLFTIAVLDREVMSSFSVVVLAVDNGSPRASSTATVDVTVNDVNDNAPYFIKNMFEVIIQEGSPINTALLNVEAADSDTGKNSAFVYSLDTSRGGEIPFRIDEKSGMVFTIEVLDRETTPHFDVIVVARDLGVPPLSSSAIISVTVDDINDNTPAFLQNVYEASIFEISPINTILLQVEATDMDFGNNGDVVYTLSESSGVEVPFRIDGESGMVFTTAVLDRETIPHFDFIVVACDRGVPQLSSSAIVSVTVDDVNDNTPVFLQSTYEASILENTPNNTLLLQVQATDVDFGNNGDIVYTLSESSEVEVPFRIDEENGMIFTNMVLDREAIPYFNITVIARDLGVPQLSSSAIISVTVDDVNDNAPLFPVSYQVFRVPGDTTNGTQIYTFSAFDADSEQNGEVSFSLAVSGSPFYLSTEGVLRVVGVLNREENAEYQLEILATDNGTPPLKTSLGITIEVV